MKVKVKAPAPGKTPRKSQKESPLDVFASVPKPAEKPSLINKCIRIIRQDIRDAMNGGLEGRQAREEQYRQICELARGREEMYAPWQNRQKKV